MKDLNPTTRRFPRTSLEAFHTFDCVEGPYKDEKTARAHEVAEHILMLVCTFGMGFVTCYLMYT